MKERYMLKGAVFLILTKIENGREYILLQKRCNTGLLDGQYDVSASGHLEENETLKEAIMRETKEEIGITIDKDNLNYCSTMHATFREGEYVLVIFSADKYKGVPTIMEPNKCSELEWFSIDELPPEIADTRKIMIESYKNNTNYIEYGFND